MNKKSILKTMFLFVATLVCTFLYNMTTIHAAYEGQTPVVSYDASVAQDNSITIAIYKNTADLSQYEMYVKGQGDMRDFLDDLPWINMNEQPFEPIYNITKVTIENDVTDIGGGIFAFLNVNEIVLPSGVTKIGEYAFAYNSITSINLPSSLETIQAAAFAFSGLESIDIPANVKSMSEGAFVYSEKLATVTGMEGLDSIAPQAFRSTAIETINIPSNIKTILPFAFAMCEKLASITGMNGVEQIQEGAFAYTAITNLSLPSSLLAYDAKATEGCEKFESFIVDEESTNFTSVDGILYSKNKEILYSYPQNKTGDTYTTESSTVSVANYAFQFNKNLLNLTFTAGVVNFGEYLISDSKIENIIVNSNTVSLQNNSFIGGSVTLIKGHIASDLYEYVTNIGISFESLCELEASASDDGKTKYIKTTDCDSVLVEVSAPEESFYTSREVFPEIYNPYSLDIETKYTDTQGQQVEPINVGDYVVTVTFDGISVVYQYEITKADPFVVAPVSLDAEYTWLEQTIITAGSTTGGHLEYKLDGGEWSTNLPKATQPGTYVVWYKVVGNENYNDVSPVSFEAKILRAQLRVVDPIAKEGLIYNGEIQYLVEEGASNVGLMSYKLNDGEWSYAVPNTINAGTYVIQYKVEVTGYETYGPLSLEVVVSKVMPVLTAPTEKDLTYNTEEQELVNAGSTTGGDLEYKVNDGVWNIALPKATIPGTYVVSYRVSGGINYYDIPESSLNVVIKKATPLVTAPIAKDLTYNAEEQELVEAGTTDVGNVEYSLDNVEWSNEIPKAINANTYTVWYKVDVNEYYNVVGPLSISVEIKKALITYTAPTAKEIIYNGEEQVLINAGTTEQGEMQYKLGDSEWSVELPKATNLNTYIVWYKVIGTENYADVEPQYIEVEIDKATPQVVSPAPKTLNYTGYAQTLIEAGTTNMGTLQYSLDGISYSSDLPSAKNAGTYTVWYKIDETENYNSVGPLSVTVIINKVGITITADDKVMDERDELPNFTYKVEGLLADDTLISEPTRTLNAPEDVKNKAGIYDIVIKDADAGENYTITYVNAKLTVNNKLTGAEIALIVIGITGTIALAAGTCWFVIFKKKRILINRA